MTTAAVHVCRAPSFVFRRIRSCGACGLRGRFVVADHAWWGATFTCCNCGAEYDTDEGRRRQTPAQREIARQDAKAAWRAAPPRRDVEAALRDYFGSSA